MTIGLRSGGLKITKTRHSHTDDIAFVESRREPRIILSIPVRYTLANRRDSNGDRREFVGRIINISLHALAIFASVKGEIGERVIAQSDEFGILEGSINRLLDRGFVMTIATTAEGRAKLETKIEIYENIKNHDFSDRRRHKRIVPPDAHSLIVFGDNSRMECRVIDISESGAAVAATIKPPIGTPISLGALAGLVVRHFAEGFAVQFVKSNI